MNPDHICDNVDDFPLKKFLQIGEGKGKDVLILGEAPAPNGWRLSGRAFYTVEGNLLPTGKNLNKLLAPLDLTVEKSSFTELIKCFVGKDRKLLTQCGSKCWPIFLRQIRNYEFKLIIILGVKTLEIFNTLAESNLVIGTLDDIELGAKIYKVLPIYHPSPIAPFNHKNNILIFSKVYKDIKTILDS